MAACRPPPAGSDSRVPARPAISATTTSALAAAGHGSMPRGPARNFSCGRIGIALSSGIEGPARATLAAGTERTGRRRPWVWARRRPVAGHPDQHGPLVLDGLVELVALDVEAGEAPVEPARASTSRPRPAVPARRDDDHADDDASTMTPTASASADRGHHGSPPLTRRTRRRPRP